MLEEQTRAYHHMYPEVYYKIQPYVMMACDEMDIYDDYEMPSHEMIMQMSDRVYDDVCKMYPEYADYDHYREMSYEAAEAYNLAGNIEQQQYYRRGGIFGDLVTIVLLNELFGRRRRRRRYYW